MKKDNTFTDVLRFLSNRIFILTVLVGVLFYVLIARLFELQIVHGERFLHEFEASIEREVVLPAHRGTIYDAFGRPLAVNHFVYNLKLDPSILVSDAERNNMVYNLLEVLRQNEETFIDDFPISQHEPFEFTFTSDDEDIRQRRENRWKQDMGLRLDLTADEAFNALRSRFRLGEGSDFEHFSNTELRDMVAMRSRIFMTRYNRLTPITIAENVSLETVTAVVEDSNTFRSLVASTDALRYYPQGIYMAHILGYVGNVPAEHPDIPNLIELGFNINDYRIGRTGIEASFENNLRGTNGSESVLVSINGRRVESLPETRVEPAPGDSVFLTIDTALQQKTFRILEEMLTEILIFRLTSNTSDDRITPTELLSSFVRANNLSVRDIFESEIGSHSYALRSYLLSLEEYVSIATRSDRALANRLLADGIDEGYISLLDVIHTMIEQEIITIDDGFILTNSNITSFLVEKIQLGEITPQTAALDPFSASLVVMDVQTGAVLAAPTYPSYDNNEFITNFNDIFFRLQDDPTEPGVNRPFQENRAPGSTFKMISAIAALEFGIIDTNTIIHDEVVFTRAGRPYLRSWSSSSFGRINVINAIERSSNFFFADVLFSIGDESPDNPLLGIETLNTYMRAFGLDQRSGVEIGNSLGAFSSPTFKETHRGEPWFGGDTAASAIGQAFNSYSAAVMVKYTGALATKGELRDLHLLNKIVSRDNIIRHVPTTVDMGVDISASTWEAVHQGMLAVTEGRNGTAVNLFNGFPMSIGSKTGTAEEMHNRPSHTSFNAFAPFDNPQIAIYVSAPFSHIDGFPSPATQIGRRVLEAFFQFDTQPLRPLETNTLVR